MNFTSEYQFKYNTDDRELEYVEYERPEKFFTTNKEGNKVNDIVAIVGKNGVGKSTLINYLKDHIFYCFSKLSPGEIVIFKSNDKLIVYDNIEIKNIKGQNLLINNIHFKCERIKKEHVDNNQKSGSLAIFYSNVFDYPEQGYNGNEYINITTNFLILDHSNKYLENEGIDIEEKKLYLANTPVIYKYMEVKNEVKFLLEKNSDVPFKIKIDTLNFTINGRYVDGVSEEIKKIFLNDEKKQNEWNNIIKNMTEIDKTMFYAFIREYKNLFLNSNEVERILNVILDEEYSERIKCTSDLISVMGDLSADENIRTVLKDIITIIIGFEKYDNSTGCYTINIKEVMKYIEILNKSFRLTQPFFIDWKLSSGEKALLSMYSRFYSVSKDDKLKEYNKEGNIINIFIDECDVYLHPEWQRTYIKNLIDMCNNIFKKYKFRINIILTTHSPIILSDLPGRNVILLDLENEKAIIKNSFENNKLTFGSNINKLYAENFFFENCLIGEFAKEKIEFVFDKILNDSISCLKENYSSYKNIISIIGEPLIREKMDESLEKRINESLNKDEIQNKIKRLENEIKLLKDIPENNKYD